MKVDGMSQALGKTISGFVLKKSPVRPYGVQSQLCIVFTDGTWLEFYTTNGTIIATNRVNPGGMQNARAYIAEQFEDFTVIAAD